MTLTLVTAPASEPIYLDQAKLYARIDGTTEDSLVEAAIVAARERVEMFTQRQLLTATWDLMLAEFPHERWLDVPLPPLQSVTYVKYYDTDNVLQTYAATNYVVFAPSGPEAQPGIVWLKDTSDWPSTYTRPDAVQMRFVAGYGAVASSVPQSIQHAIRLRVADAFDSRDGMDSAKSAETFEALLWPYRVF